MRKAVFLQMCTELSSELTCPHECPTEYRESAGDSDLKAGSPQLPLVCPASSAWASLLLKLLFMRHAPLSGKRSVHGS